MSAVLKSQTTPKAQKVLNLKIDVNQPEYDEEGQLIVDSEEDEEAYENFEGIFNAHLLEDEYLDQQSYKGSMTDEDSSLVENKLMNEQEREEDIKKHLNVDFSENEENEQAHLRRISIEEYQDSGLGAELENYNRNNDNSRDHDRDHEFTAQELAQNRGSIIGQFYNQEEGGRNSTYYDYNDSSNIIPEDHYHENEVEA